MADIRRQPHDGGNLFLVGKEERLHGERIPFKEYAHALLVPGIAVGGDEAFDGRMKPAGEDRHEPSVGNVFSNLNKRHVDGNSHVAEERIADGEDVGRADGASKLNGRFPSAAEKHARFASHGTVVDVARMKLQVFRVDRHAVAADVPGTCNRDVMEREELTQLVR